VNKRLSSNKRTLFFSKRNIWNRVATFRSEREMKKYLSEIPKIVWKNKYSKVCLDCDKTVVDGQIINTTTTTATTTTRHLRVIKHGYSDNCSLADLTYSKTRYKLEFCNHTSTTFSLYRIGLFGFGFKIIKID
jgi:hypothetical protein